VNIGRLKIIQGEDKQFDIRLFRDAGYGPEPFDLTGAQEVKCVFVKSDDTALIKSSVSGGDVSILSPATSGKVRFILSDSDTKLLKKGEELSFEVEVTVADITSIVQFVEVLTVLEREVSTE
jgi:hypothetical protein